MNIKRFLITILIFSFFITGCNKETPTPPENHLLIDKAKNRLDIYKEVKLTADLSQLSKKQKKLILRLIEASTIMDDLFWQQAFHQNKDDFLNQILDPKVKAFAVINYGPWDRLDADKPFLSNFENKPLGAQFYPQGITKQEFEHSNFNDKQGLYSLIKRNKEGHLYSIAYSEVYSDELNRASAILEEAALLAENKGLSTYLSLRAKALLNDDYYASDIAWMEMKDNLIDVVIGPIETYEDQLYGYRSGFEAYVLLKDKDWSNKLAKYVEYLPKLQKSLPVNRKYKKEIPGLNADLNAYDALYYAGHANAGSKTIAINLPNDEKVQLEKGTRRLQLKNAMQAKFDHILKPISDILIVPEQRKFINFNAFFSNTMFHEIAHGLGIKNTINGKGTVREALKEHASALEEGKADVLGLHMISQLIEQGVITEGSIEEYYTTFLAGIFRSVRFGASSAHGKANMVRFNYFEEQNAFHRNEQGEYQINMEKMKLAVQSLSKIILTLQGNGDYEKVSLLVKDKGIINKELEKDLARLTTANIPVDITFEQGKKILGL